MLTSKILLPHRASHRPPRAARYLTPTPTPIPTYTGTLALVASAFRVVSASAASDIAGTVYASFRDADAASKSPPPLLRSRRPTPESSNFRNLSVVEGGLIPYRPISVDINLVHRARFCEHPAISDCVQLEAVRPQIKHHYAGVLLRINEGAARRRYILLSMLWRNRQQTKTRTM